MFAILASLVVCDTGLCHMIALLTLVFLCLAWVTIFSENPYRSSNPYFENIYRVSHKKLYLVWRAVAPLNFELGIKVGGVLESSGSQL